MKTRSKHIHILMGAALAAVLILPACKKQKIETPDFDVSVAKTTFAVNEPISFTFSGTADVVQFFSGAAGAEYEFKDRTTVTGKPQITFTTVRTVPTNLQPNTLSLLVSKDFKNSLNAEDIQTATWADLSSRVTWSTGANANPVASGVVDLSDQYSPGAPVFIAFRYKADKSATVAQPNWTIREVAVNNVLADGTVVPVTNSSSMNWGTFSIAGAQTWSLSTITAPTITGGGVNIDGNEDWLISLPIELDRAQRVFGTSVRTTPTTRLDSYTFAGYAAPGTYKATFEAMNANRWDTKKVVREIIIKVQ